jgi:DNA-directed RNA polymerase subunit E'/Rpb7
METISPYIDTNLNIKIELEPHELDNEIRNHIENKIKQLEGKCHKEGFISQVFSISNYSKGYIKPEDLMCKTVFDVSFYCQICNPQINTIIEATITKIDPTMISCVYGPIIIIIQTNKINPNVNHLTLKINDIVKVRVLQKRFFPNDKNIKVLGFLEEKVTS